MARRYQRSIFIGLDEFGQKIVERLSKEATADISYLNFFLSKFKSNVFQDSLENIKELDQKKFDTKKYEISSLRGKELFEFNILFIGETVSKSLEVWKEAEKIIKEKELFTAESIFVIKGDENQRPFQMGNLPRAFIVTSELETKAKVKKEELEKSILEFLSLFLYGNIYEDRDFFNKAIIGGENKQLSFGLVSLSLPVFEIVEPACLFVVRKLLKEIIGAKETENEETEFTTVKNWIDVLDDVKEKEELGLPHLEFKYIPKIKLFNKYNIREKSFERLLSETANSISKYTNSKNQLATKSRKDLEAKVKKTIEERRNEILKLISDRNLKITTLSKLRVRLNCLIGKNGLISAAKDELGKVHENWQAYPRLDFPKNISKHPYWLLGLIPLLIGLFPWLLRWLFISSISLSLCLEFSISAILIIFLYLLFSKLMIIFVVHRLKVNYEKAINGIDKFYHQNFKALVSTYRLILMNKLIEKLEFDQKCLSVFIAYLEEKLDEIDKNIAKIQGISLGEESDQINISKKEIETLLNEIGILDLKLEEISIEFNAWIKTNYEEFFNGFFENLKSELNKRVLEKRKDLFIYINNTKNLKEKLIRILQEERPLPFYYHKLSTSNLLIYYPEDFKIEEIEEKIRKVKKIKMDIPDRIGILNVSY
jgi:hypothetical protein